MSLDVAHFAIRWYNSASTLIPVVNRNTMYFGRSMEASKNTAFHQAVGIRWAKAA